jgi:hypothetical protein
LDSDIYPDGFSSLASIRIASPRQINHQEYFHKALFYQYFGQFYAAIVP